MINKAIGLIVVSVIIGTVGQLCIKAAMLRLGPMAFNTPAAILHSIFQILQQPLIIVALPLYGMGFILWAVALSYLPLGYAYPLLASGYLINPLAAMFLFHEPMPPLRAIGIAIIAVGIILVGRS